jgi:hypothetical protein
MKGLNTQFAMLIVLSISALTLSGCRMGEPKYKPGYSDAAKVDAEKLKKEKAAEKAAEKAQAHQNPDNKAAAEKAAAEKAAADKRAADAEAAAKKAPAAPAQGANKGAVGGTGTTSPATAVTPVKPEPSKVEKVAVKQEALSLTKALMVKLESSNNQSTQVKLGCQNSASLAAASDVAKSEDDILFLEGSSALVASATVMNEDKIEAFDCFKTEASAQANRIVVPTIELKQGVAQQVTLFLRGREMQMEVLCLKNLKKAGSTLRGIVLEAGSMAFVKNQAALSLVSCK